MKLSRIFADGTDLDINWDALEAKAEKEGWLTKKASQKDVSVTEKQLDATRKEDAPNQITEKQLDPEHKDDKSAVITEKQLDAVRAKA